MVSRGQKEDEKTLVQFTTTVQLTTPPSHLTDHPPYDLDMTLLPSQISGVRACSHKKRPRDTSHVPTITSSSTHHPYVSLQNGPNFPFESIAHSRTRAPPARPRKRTLTTTSRGLPAATVQHHGKPHNTPSERCRPATIRPHHREPPRDDTPAPRRTVGEGRNQTHRRGISTHGRRRPSRPGLQHGHGRVLARGQRVPHRGGFRHAGLPLRSGADESLCGVCLRAGLCGGERGLFSFSKPYFFYCAIYMKSAGEGAKEEMCMGLY